VNGSRPFTIVLDSGAFYTVRQPEIATELHVKTSGTQEMTGLSANATLRMVQDASPEFAGQRLTGQPLSVLPVDYIEKEVGHRTEGILGGSFFLKFAILAACRGKYCLSYESQHNPSWGSV
jgi:hypothetical protein